jgi:hypothetical protein
VKDIVGPLTEKVGRRLKVRTQWFVRTGGALPHGDDMAVAEERGGLAIDDVAAGEMRGAADDEQLIAVYIDLRQLAVLERVLNRKRMQAVQSAQGLDLVATRVRQADPDELGAVVGTMHALVDRDLTNPATMAVQISGNDGQGSSLISGGARTPVRRAAARVHAR